MSDREELVALRARVRLYIHSASPSTPEESKGACGCVSCALYRDCAPKPVDPWELLKKAERWFNPYPDSRKHYVSELRNLCEEIESALAAHEREGRA